MTTRTTGTNDHVGQDARRVADAALRGADLSMDWRAAGYDTREAAAAAMVGDDYGDTLVWREAIRIVAEAL